MTGIAKEAIAAIVKLVFKVIWYVLLVVLIFTGIYTGLDIYQTETARSQVFGEIEQHDYWEDFDIFNCNLSDAIFYGINNNTGYEFKTAIQKSVPFDGSKNSYSVLINNAPSVKEKSSAGVLTAEHTINYYDINGVHELSTTLSIEIRFYQSELQITIQTDNNESEHAHFLEYKKFNGFTLRIIDAQFKPGVSTTKTYTANFIGFENQLIESQRLIKYATIVAPAAPKIDGYRFTGWSPAVPSYITENCIFIAVYEELPEIRLDVERVTDSGMIIFSDTSGVVQNIFDKITGIILDGTVTATYHGDSVDVIFNYQELTAVDKGADAGGSILNFNTVNVNIGSKSIPLHFVFALDKGGFTLGIIDDQGSNSWIDFVSSTDLQMYVII